MLCATATETVYQRAASSQFCSGVVEKWRAGQDETKAGLNGVSLGPMYRPVARHSVAASRATKERITPVQDARAADSQSPGGIPDCFHQTMFPTPVASHAEVTGPEARDGSIVECIGAQAQAAQSTCIRWTHSMRLRSRSHQRQLLKSAREQPASRRQHAFPMTQETCGECLIEHRTGDDGVHLCDGQTRPKVCVRHREPTCPQAGAPSAFDTDAPVTIRGSRPAKLSAATSSP